MTSEYTWPNHLMATDREATETLISQHGFQEDVAYGRTKVFIRTPRTLFLLEQERAQLIPMLVLLLQKVPGDCASVCVLRVVAAGYGWVCVCERGGSSDRIRGGTLCISGSI